MEYLPHPLRAFFLNGPTARWNRVAWWILLAGIAVSLAAAAIWRMEVRSAVERSFSAQASSVGSNVTVELLRMDDLAVDARALISSEPQVTNRQVAMWWAGMTAARRYSDVDGFGYLAFVPAARLHAFASELRTDPIPGTAMESGPLAIEPSGIRSYYCLAQLGVAEALNQMLISPGFDYCAVPGFSALQSARDSGQFMVLTLGDRTLAVFAPVYQDDQIPGTVSARRRLAMGTVVELVDLHSLLLQAAAGHPGLAIAISRRGASAGTSSGLARHFVQRLGQVTKIAGIGTASAGAMRDSFTVNADGDWTVTVSQAPGKFITASNLQSFILLIAGVSASILAFLLVRNLSSDRARALRLAEDRTEQLRHQAMHDALTNLPNRQFLFERAEQLVADAHQRNTEIAAMFVDIDDFKRINDQFGHANGDAVLRVVAERISSVLRSTDIAGRIGGDEFVVVAGSRHSERGFGGLAERILDALRKPVPISPETALNVTASIGLAAGAAKNAEQLIGNADIALYEAKSNGKDRYTAFGPEMRTVHDSMMRRWPNKRMAAREPAEPVVAHDATPRLIEADTA